MGPFFKFEMNLMSIECLKTLQSIVMNVFECLIIIF